MKGPGDCCPNCHGALAPGQRTVCPACGSPLQPPGARAAAWYYAHNKQRIGPLSSAQLQALAKAGSLAPGDMVLRAGTNKWVEARKVKGLFPEPAAAPMVPPPPVVPERATAVPGFGSRRELLAEGQVVPEASRCVQCGCCSYNCPIGIDVRAHAWRGLSIHDSHCLTCGECVKRCPRGVLSFERLTLFTREC